MPIPYKPISQKVLIEQEIRDQNAATRNLAKEAEKDYEKLCAEECLKEATLNSIDAARAKRERIVGFKEQVRVRLLEHAIFSVFKSVMEGCEVYAKDEDGMPTLDPDEPVMESMVYTFINENGGPSVLMAKSMNHGNTSGFIAGMNGIIKHHFKRIIENVEDNLKAGMDEEEALKANDPEMNPFKQDVDDYIKNCGITDPISQRVIAAIDDFVTSNAKDKANIVKALELTKDKVESLNTEDEAVAESYTRLGKRLVADIRNKPRSLFGEMVHRMINNVMSSNIKTAYITEDSHVDVEKVINKVSMMYGFLETVNSLNLIDIDEAYITNMLKEMSESK